MVWGTFILLILATGTLYQFIGLRRAERTYVPPGTMVTVDRQRLHVVAAGTGSPPLATMLDTRASAPASVDYRGRHINVSGETWLGAYRDGQAAH